jgi:hypothetical protein
MKKRQFCSFLVKQSWSLYPLSRRPDKSSTTPRSATFIFYHPLNQWFSNFFDSRHKKITKIWPRHSTFKNIEFLTNTRLWLVLELQILPLSGSFIQIYDHDILYELNLFLTTPKERKFKYNLCCVNFFLHIFNSLAAHSLRITALNGLANFN